MLKLLAWVPEPWGSLGLVAVVFGAWLWGDVTGRGTERQRNEVARLAQTVATLERQRDSAESIQLQMAARLSELREQREIKEKSLAELVAKIRSEPSSGACTLSSARRMRLLSIRIGSPRTNPGP